MKTRLPFLIALIALVSASAIGQPLPALPATPSLPPGYPSGVPSRTSKQPETPKLTTFSLDFPGGNPNDLVSYIEKATGKPLNVIIPAEHAQVRLPPLKMNNVDVRQLFQALGPASQSTEAVRTSGGSYQRFQTGYGFRTSGEYSDDSIWYFFVERPTPPPPVTPDVPKVCRFYPLTSYLEGGLTVDDITTAIQTGWKMLGDQETPAISFHKETKLLIAVGDPTRLETIDAVLKALAPTTGDVFNDRIQSIVRKAGAGNSPPPAPKPVEKPKTEN